MDFKINVCFGVGSFVHYLHNKRANEHPQPKDSSTIYNNTASASCLMRVLNSVLCSPESIQRHTGGCLVFSTTQSPNEKTLCSRLSLGWANDEHIDWLIHEPWTCATSILEVFTTRSWYLLIDRSEFQEEWIYYSAVRGQMIEEFRSVLLYRRRQRVQPR